MSSGKLRRKIGREDVRVRPSYIDIGAGAGVQPSHDALPSLDLLNLVKKDVRHGARVGGLEGSAKVLDEALGRLLEREAKLVEATVEDVALGHALGDQAVTERGEDGRLPATAHALEHLDLLGIAKRVEHALVIRAIYVADAAYHDRHHPGIISTIPEIAHV